MNQLNLESRFCDVIFFLGGSYISCVIMLCLLIEYVFPLVLFSILGIPIVYIICGFKDTYKKIGVNIGWLKYYSDTKYDVWRGENYKWADEKPPALKESKKKTSSVLREGPFSAAGLGMAQGQALAQRQAMAAVGGFAGR